MWVSSKFSDWFHVSQEAVQSLREELAATKAERDTLKLQAAVDRINFDWLRVRVNSLEVEKVALIEKAYSIKLPAPEIARTPVIGQEARMDEFSFQDIGEDLARKFGLPAYETK